MVRFDDRLQTVLRQPASDPRDAAVRWRQLVDLIARAGPAIDSQLLGEALTVIAADAPRIDQSLRAAAARTIAALPLPFRLLEYFVADRLSVSAPILASASLDRDQWATLLALADRETKQFVETLHPELAGMTAGNMIEELVDHRPHQSNDPHSDRTTISDVVARIERRRRRRPAWDNRGAEQPAKHGELAVFRWECGPNGEIGWVEGAPRGALIGRSIARARENGDRIQEGAVRAFSQRAPFRDAQMVLAGEGPVAGNWKISGVPAFDPADGRFAGYRGIALRELSGSQQAIEQGANRILEADSLRELVHEVKTPLNAIIGFAEIIDGQFLGPAGRRYRQRATAIVEQARVLLGAIDDLDLLARAQSGASPTRDPGDLGDAVQLAIDDLRHTAEENRIELSYAPAAERVATVIGGDALLQLVKRLVAAALEFAVAGERMQAATALASGRARLTMSRPVALTDLQASGGNGPIDGKFSLHLTRGLARIAGGDLTIDGNLLVLSLPSA